MLKDPACFQKILVTGSPGAGKSTFARKLRDTLDLPLYYLDQLWHRPDGTHVSRETFDAALADILQRDRWIIDGNYSRTMEVRLKACDAVFLLDYPTELCLAGAKSRIGTVREDLPWVERTFDPEFRRWIEDFSRDQLPRIYELLQQVRENRTVTIFKSRQEADAWFARLERRPAHAQSL